MNILAGLPIGAKIVGGIVATATAVAVPTVIIINNNANKPPEVPQANVAQQVKTSEAPTEKVDIVKTEPKKETPKTTTEPAKVEPVTPVKTEQPAPRSTQNPTPTPAPTREELFAKAVTEFKATVVVSGNKEVTGKDFLDRMRSSYLSIINQGETDEKLARRRLENLYPIYTTLNMALPASLRFAKILQNYGLIDANLTEEKFVIQARNVAYPYLIGLAISDNY